MKSRLPVLLATIALVAPGFAVAASPQAATTVSVKVADTRAAMRDLWVDHVFWVRNVVDARLGGNDARARASEQEVVANAKAISRAIAPFYGDAASEKLFGLLAGHWGAVSDHLNATRSGDKGAQDAAFGKLVANAGEISTFLGGANPHLPVATLKSLLTAHGAHHVQQIQQLKAGQYAEEASTWTAMTDHMHVIADALATGIAAQFPDRFR